MIIKMQKCPSHANLEPLPESKGVEKGCFVEEKKSWGQAGDFPERRMRSKDTEVETCTPGGKLG